MMLLSMANTTENDSNLCVCITNDANAATNFTGMSARFGSTHDAEKMFAPNSQKKKNVCRFLAIVVFFSAPELPERSHLNSAPSSSLFSSQSTSLTTLS